MRLLKFTDRESAKTHLLLYQHETDEQKTLNLPRHYSYWFMQPVAYFLTLSFIPSYQFDSLVCLYDEYDYDCELNMNTKLMLAFEVLCTLSHLHNYCFTEEDTEDLGERDWIVELINSWIYEYKYQAQLNNTSQYKIGPFRFPLRENKVTQFPSWYSKLLFLRLSFSHFQFETKVVVC